MYTHAHRNIRICNPYTKSTYCLGNNALASHQYQTFPGGTFSQGYVYLQTPLDGIPFRGCSPLLLFAYSVYEIPYTSVGSSINTFYKTMHVEVCTSLQVKLFQMNTSLILCQSSNSEFLFYSNNKSRPCRGIMRVSLIFQQVQLCLLFIQNCRPDHCSLCHSRMQQPPYNSYLAISLLYIVRCITTYYTLFYPKHQHAYFLQTEIAHYNCIICALLSLAQIIVKLQRLLRFGPDFFKTGSTSFCCFLYILFSCVANHTCGWGNRFVSCHSYDVDIIYYRRQFWGSSRCIYYTVYFSAVQLITHVGGGIGLSGFILMMWTLFTIDDSLAVGGIFFGVAGACTVLYFSAVQLITHVGGGRQVQVSFLLIFMMWTLFTMDNSFGGGGIFGAGANSSASPIYTHKHSLLTDS